MYAQQFSGSREILVWSFLYSSLYEPAHEIMVLFVLRKLIFQTRLCSHPVRLDVWFFVRPFVYFYMSCANSESSGETAWMPGLAWAFADRWMPMWSHELAHTVRAKVKALVRLPRWAIAVRICNKSQFYTSQLIMLFACFPQDVILPLISRQVKNPYNLAYINHLIPVICFSKMQAEWQTVKTMIRLLLQSGPCQVKMCLREFATS